MRSRGGSGETKKMNKTSNLLGWIGVGLILLAYAGISFNQLQPQSWLYQIMNLSGSVFIIVSSLQKRDYQPVVLNVAWALIAIIGLLSLII